MVLVLAMTVIVTTIGVALVGLMGTDLFHASIQHAVAQSFYTARAGLEEARMRLAAAADPQAYTTPDRGVTRAYGRGQYTYWIDAGPAQGCGPGLKTIEALGEVALRFGSIPTRIMACGAPGVPEAITLFGVSRVEFRGDASRTYLAPYQVGAPGGGGNLGSFTEIHFADPAVRVNAVSEDGVDAVAGRAATPVPDYALFGFGTAPEYEPDPKTDPAPWILGVFGDLLKARPKGAQVPNDCGTAYACVTAQRTIGDIPDVASLRRDVESMTAGGHRMRHVYFNRMRRVVLPWLALDAAGFRAAAADNAGNAALNAAVGLAGKTDAIYTPLQFYQLAGYLQAHPGAVVHGTVYVTGTLEFVHDVDLGGEAGDATLVVEGDVVVDAEVSLMNRHDLSTVAGRRMPGILVFGFPQPAARTTTVCRGQTINGSGRLVLCGGTAQRLVVDGLVYTADGMAMLHGASVDQIGAMYHNSRGTSQTSFVNEDATLALRFDPLALSVFGKGVAILSWQQLP